MKKLLIVALTVFLGCARPVPEAPQAPIVVHVPPPPFVERPKNPCSSDLIGAAVNGACCKVSCQEDGCSAARYISCGEEVLTKYFEQYSCKSNDIDFDVTCEKSLHE